MRLSNTTLPLIAALAACAATTSNRAAVRPQETGVKEGTVAQAFGRVHTSVVTLRTVSEWPVASQEGQVVTKKGVGSGTLITKDGKVLTAAHVVQTAAELEAIFHDGTKLPARVVSSDPLIDLALVQLDGRIPEGIRPAELGDSALARVGGQVFVVGAPLGITHTLTVGHLSARRAAAFLDPKLPVEVFQTDAAINPGNSGGPLFAMSGRVIGVVTSIVSLSGGDQGLGFAVTSNTAKKLLLERNPAWSGMDFVFLRDRYAEILNVPSGQAAYLVQRVAPGSPAERLGLQGGDVRAEIEKHKILLGGDVILEVLGKGLDERAEIRKAMDALGPDDELAVVVMREGNLVNLRKPWGELRGE